MSSSSSLKTSSAIPRQAVSSKPSMGSGSHFDDHHRDADGDHNENGFRRGDFLKFRNGLSAAALFLLLPLLK